MEQASSFDSETAIADTARRGSNQSGMRAYNERLVLSLIRQNGAMAKADIARQTRLSAQTVSVIMRALEADGLLVRGEPVRGRIGQPSIPMGLAKDGAFFFGLKVGRRSLDLVLTDFLGVVQQRLCTDHAFPTPENTVHFVKQSVGQILGRMPPEHRSRIAGMGIALPFRLWDWPETQGVGAAEMRGWQDHDIAAEIAAVWDFPVFVCNDASTACCAELVFGGQGKPPDFLYFFVGFFIGGGLVIDNSLYTGRTGNAAALGSMMVTTGDGTRRQLVEVASLAVLERAIAESSDQSAMIWNAPDSWNVPEGPLDAWLDAAAQGIAQAIASSICLIDVGHVLVDGWMPQDMRAELVRRITMQVADAPVAGVQKPQILEGSIGPDARALGAASLPLSSRFLVERHSYQKGTSK